MKYLRWTFLFFSFLFFTSLAHSLRYLKVGFGVAVRGVERNRNRHGGNTCMALYVLV